MRYVLESKSEFDRLEHQSGLSAYDYLRELAFEPLCIAYRSERDPSLRWVIANALAGMARFEEVRVLPGIGEYATLFS